MTDRIQPELDIVYQAYRQHTHTDGDEHDRNDDGNFERIMPALSYQLLEPTSQWPGVRVRAGFLVPTRGETEGIGQETGFDLLAAATQPFGDTRLHAALGFAVPLREDVGRHFDIAPQLFRRMAAQEQAVEERRFAVRIFQFVLAFDLFHRKLHRQIQAENAVYRIGALRQEGGAKN